MLLGSGDRLPFTNARLRKAYETYESNQRLPRHFGTLIRTDPGWNILIVLYLLDAFGRRPSVSRLTEVSAGPMTTVLRALERFEEKGLIARYPQSHDRRIVQIGLTPEGRKALDAYFTESEEAVISAA